MGFWEEKMLMAQNHGTRFLRNYIITTTQPEESFIKRLYPNVCDIKFRRMCSQCEECSVTFLSNSTTLEKPVKNIVLCRLVV